MNPAKDYNQNITETKTGSELSFKKMENFNKYMASLNCLIIE
jgi:hypothetical protein